MGIQAKGKQAGDCANRGTGEKPFPVAEIEAGLHSDIS
jgi:hypothetical protein